MIDLRFLLFENPQLLVKDLQAALRANSLIAAFAFELRNLLQAEAKGLAGTDRPGDFEVVGSELLIAVSTAPDASGRLEQAEADVETDRVAAQTGHFREL